MKLKIKLLIIVLIVIILIKYFNKKKINDKNKDRNYIFIGGHARSGTTLMKVILDIDSQVKCGLDESIIIPQFVELILNFDQHLVVTREKLDAEVANFISNIMNNRHLNGTRMCAKDPDIIKYIDYVNYLFPNAKFIYMVSKLLYHNRTFINFLMN